MDCSEPSGHGRRRRPRDRRNSPRGRQVRQEQSHTRRADHNPNTGREANVTTLEERDGVSISDVVIRSTENGPNLVLLDGTDVHAWCRCRGSTLLPFFDGAYNMNEFTAKTHEVKVR